MVITMSKPKGKTSANRAGSKTAAGKKANPSTEEASFSGIQRPLSLVAQVEQTLRTAIADDLFPSGRMPTLVELADQMRVSRETVRLALDSLQRDGLIVKRRRRGTFVSAPTVPQKLKAPKRKILGYLFEDYEFGGTHSEVIARPHGSAMLEGAIMEAGRHDYQLVTRSAKPTNIREAFDQLNDLGPLCGTIFTCVGEEKFLKGISGRSMPAVLLDHEMHLPKVGSIRGDSQQNARLAIQHLAELGHRNIACAHWRQSDLNPWFLQGYRKGMRDVNLKRSREWEMFVELNEKGAMETVEQLLKFRKRPTAIICFHNTFASQLIAAAWKKGIRVPEDLSVVGGGGEEVVNLTCMQIDWHELGATAVRMVLKAIDQGKEHKTEHLLLPYDLKIGGTTSKLRDSEKKK